MGQSDKGRWLLWWHVVSRGFFTTAVNAKLGYLWIGLVLIYLSTLCFWTSVYYLSWRTHGRHCFVGFDGPVSAFLFALETQQTIGYGTRAPGDCISTALLVGTHSLFAMILDSIIIGIVFARISHPKTRGRTILLSDSAVICRRDGCLKLMFRVADIQRSKVVSPTILAVLYTWGDGRLTAEGESIPVQSFDLKLDPWDCSLLLPTIVSHTIDETSPLCGLHLKSLEALGAEIVVAFEGSTELGDMFQVRQSYLPQEIHWGCTFSSIISKAGQGETQHLVDLSRFHDVEPIHNLMAIPPHRMSQRIVAGLSVTTESPEGSQWQGIAPRAEAGASTMAGNGGVRSPRSSSSFSRPQVSPLPLPPPLYGENTLCISNEGCIGPRDGKLFLMFRVGDTFPNCQFHNIKIRVQLFKWAPKVTAEGEVMPLTVCDLHMTPEEPILRYPLIIAHELSPDSPVASWRTPDGKWFDADSDIVVRVSGTLASTGQIFTRTRELAVYSSIKWGELFAPCVSRVPTALNPSGSVRVDWDSFSSMTSVAKEHLSVADPSIARPASLSMKNPSFAKVYPEGGYMPAPTLIPRASTRSEENSLNDTSTPTFDGKGKSAGSRSLFAAIENMNQLAKEDGKQADGSL